LHWTYSDPDGDPRTAFEIWLDDSSSFSDPKFNKVFNISSSESSQSYVLNLSDDQEGDWLSQLSWNTTYYWKVRVKDSAGNWSEWSSVDYFPTPSHASPYIDFSWNPQSPVVGEVVQFTDQSNCYDTAGTTTCSNSTGDSFLWTFQNGNPSSSTSSNPTTTFSSVGSNSVTLKVTDSSGFFCEKTKTVNSTYPLPFWKEIPPFYYLKKFLASLISKFKFF
jgi:chitodextrinase